MKRYLIHFILLSSLMDYCFFKRLSSFLWQIIFKDSMNSLFLELRINDKKNLFHIEKYLGKNRI